MPKVTFVTADGARNEVVAKNGETLLKAAHHAKVNVEGACDGSLACSTCHVLVDDTFGRGPTSRLACQIVITDKLDGMAAVVPKPFDI